MSLEVIGIGVRDRHRRNTRCRNVVRERAAVRDAVLARTHRAQHDARCAEGACDARAFGARTDSLAVAAAVTRAFHTTVEEHELALDRARGERLQFGNIFDHHDRCRDALIRGADAAADGERHERLRVGRDGLCACFAANPARHDHLGRTNIDKAERLQRLPRPVHTGKITCRARKARADLGGQRLEQLISLIRGEGSIAKLSGGLDGLAWQRDRGRGSRAYRLACLRSERGVSCGESGEGRDADPKEVTGDAAVHQLSLVRSAATSARNWTGVRSPNSLRY